MVQITSKAAAEALEADPSVETAEMRRQAIQEEYGEWVAADEIFIDGVRAFNKGMPVPKSHVEMYPELLEEDENGAVAVVKATENAPSGGASRQAWVDYAINRGATAEEVADGGLSRNELRDKYGPK